MKTVEPIYAAAAALTLAGIGLYYLTKSSNSNQNNGGCGSPSSTSSSASCTNKPKTGRSHISITSDDGSSPTNTRVTPIAGKVDSVELRKLERMKKVEAERDEAINVAMDGLQPFGARLNEMGEYPLTRGSPTTLQVNIGLLCNQTCHHCHVEAGPTRTKENMDRKTIDQLLTVIRKNPQLKCLDITGGAPEMNPNFRHLVLEARKFGIKQIINRCNLTVLFEPGMEDMPQFFADNELHIFSSLPCYSKENVDAQRGDGVFEKSIAGLKLLNAVGYGKGNPKLKLSLVYNPGGPYLPPPQPALQQDYKQMLMEHFGIEFDDLLTITNIPIKRYVDFLEKEGQLRDYMKLLIENFNPVSVPHLMCKNVISINWEGRLFDCDFNQQLGLEMPLAQGKNLSVWDLNNLEEFAGRPIALGPHCYGCTAGAGSSCTGALL